MERRVFARHLLSYYSICYFLFKFIHYIIVFPLPHLLKDSPHLTTIHLCHTMPSFSFSLENKAKQTMNNQKPKQEKTQETCMCVCVCIQKKKLDTIMYKQKERVRILQMFNHRNERQKHLLKYYWVSLY